MRRAELAGHKLALWARHHGGPLRKEDQVVIVPLNRDPLWIGTQKAILDQAGMNKTAYRSIDDASRLRHAVDANVPILREQ
jgi:hypothetical protein